MAASSAPANEEQSSTSGVEWLLKQRHDDLATMFRSVWDNYIKFYTVFLTFSVAAMGWLIAHDPKITISRTTYHVLATVLIVQSLLTAGTSASLALYSRRIGREHLSVESEVLGCVPAPPALLNTMLIPVDLAMWSGWANAAAMLGMSVAWAYIGFWVQ